MPSGGTLEVDCGSGYVTAQAGANYSEVAGIRYTPVTGYNGLVSFTYHWSNNELDYLMDEYIGTAVTNPATEYIQVRPYVDIEAAAADTYADHKAIMGVGDTTTMTLTLENPARRRRSDHRLLGPVL